jgi:hypothetical protein
MKEGYWIKTRTGDKWQVSEHATFAKSQEGADAMGLSPRIRALIEPWSLDYNGPDRERIITEVCKGGFIRMRGHGTSWTFEFWNDRRNSLEACQQFAQEWAGPYTGLQIHDLKSNEQWSGSAQEFYRLMSSDDGPEAVLRVAKSLPRLSRRDWSSRLLLR